MNDFGKIRIPFAIALLVAMFAVKPIIDTYGTSSYTIFGLSITLSHIYTIFGSFLGATVYFYAIGLIGEKPIFELAKKIGHITYALALITPPLFLLLYPVSLITTLAVSVWSTPTISKLIEAAFVVVFGLTAYLMSGIIFDAFAQRDKSEKIEEMEDQENSLLSRAKQLYQQEYYDLAVSESWKAVEVALKKLFLSIDVKARPKTFPLLVETARKCNVLNGSQIEELVAIRSIRNDAVHTEKRMTLDEASRALNVSEKLITSLQSVGNKCHFCGRAFVAGEIEIDNIAGTAVCNECAKKNPEWKDKLALRGMGP